MPDQFAPFQIPSAPHAFTFAGRALVGYLSGWSGATERRHVVHRFPKRKGQRVEDMERDGRWLMVRLLFIGDNCARDAQQFEAFVDANPQGRLDHPVAGTWTAFCVGPQSSADFNQAINRIEVNVRFIESELDAQIPVATPDVGTAAQNVAAQQTQFQQTVAQFMGALGKAQTQAAAALAAIDSALNQVTTILTSPTALLQTAVNTALGAGASIAGTINLIKSQSDVMVADVTSFIAAATDLFSGSDTNATASSDYIGTTLGTVQNDTAALETTLTTPLPSSVIGVGGGAPAAAGPAVRDLHLLLDTCLTLNDAVLAQLPPVVQFTVPATINLIVLSQQLMTRFGIIGRDPLAYASTILGLNRIQFPQAVPAGTVLFVPTA